MSYVPSLDMSNPLELHVPECPFMGSTGLAALRLPEGLTAIGDWALLGSYFIWVPTSSLTRGESARDMDQTRRKGEGRSVNKKGLAPLKRDSRGSSVATGARRGTGRAAS